jgi:hypothetical protein
MNCEQIKKCIEEKNYKIINVIKSVNYHFNKIGGIDDLFEEETNEEDIKKVFIELKNVIKNENDLLLIVFQEFFFSYHKVIDESNKYIISEECKKITEENKNVIIFINLCHEISEEKLPINYINKLKTYIEPITDNDSKDIWRISSDPFNSLFNDERKFFYSNETFVIMRKNVLYSYKKSSYYHELINTNNYNYVMGFGQDEINLQLSGELLDIAKLLSNEISIEICFDFQKNIKAKKFENLILNDDDKFTHSQIDNLQKIRINIQDYSKKKIIIIMSNTTNIYNQLDILPNNVIICKCDPIQELVFTLNDKNDLEEIKSTESYNFHLQEKESQKEKTNLLKSIRLYNTIKEKNNSFEFQNATKLVKGFNSVRTKIELKNHQFFFLKYNSLK